MKTWKLTVTLLVAAMVFGGCDLARRSGNGASRSDSGSEQPGGAGGFTVDDDGTTRLMAPSDVQQLKGRELSTTDRSMANANGLRPEDSWIFTTKPNANGSFLVAAASRAGITGGDMIRRIDLGSTIKEFDYDEDSKGAQGAFIYVPDELRSAVPSKLVDADGMFTGSICGFVPGPNKTIIALSDGTEDGVGFVINPYETATAFTPLQAIRMPYGHNVCRGVYSEQTKKVYLVDVTQTESHGGKTGIFVADIYNDNRAVTASYYTFDNSAAINSHSLPNFQGVELYQDVLYLLSGNGRFDAEWDNVVYSVPLNTAGEPIFAEAKYTRMNNPTFRSDGCPISSNNISSLVFVKKDNTPVLLVSGTAQTQAWEIQSDATLKKIDLNEKKPGTQGFNLENNGQGGVRLAYSPDGKKLYHLPHCRSNKDKVKITGSSEEFVYNISVFSVPELKLLDPIDIGYRELLTSLRDAAYRPQFAAVMRDFAVGTKHIGVIGASGSNLSGLGAGGDVNIVDIGKKTSIAFSKPKDMRTAHEQDYGFKLAAGDPEFAKSQQNSRAIIWIP